MWRSACLGKMLYQDLCSLHGLYQEPPWTHGVVSGPMLARDLSCRALMKGIFDRSAGVWNLKETTERDLLRLLVFQQNQGIFSGCFQCFLNTWKILILASAFYSSVCLLFRVLLTLVPCLKCITQCIGMQGLISLTRSLVCWIWAHCRPKL